MVLPNEANIDDPDMVNLQGQGGLDCHAGSGHLKAILHRTAGAPGQGFSRQEKHLKTRVWGSFSPLFLFPFRFGCIVWVTPFLPVSSARKTDQPGIRFGSGSSGTSWSTLPLSVRSSRVRVKRSELGGWFQRCWQFPPSRTPGMRFHQPPSLQGGSFGSFSAFFTVTGPHRWLLGGLHIAELPQTVAIGPQGTGWKKCIATRNKCLTTRNNVC